VYFNPLLFIKSIRFSENSQGTCFVIDRKVSENELKQFGVLQ
jgi:hypothetical protein